MLDINLLSKVQLVAFDFDGVFTDNTVYVSEKGEESVRCWRSDGLGLERLRRLGINVVIISSEENIVVSIRGKKLKIPVLQGIKDKASVLLGECASRTIPMEDVIFVGNDINDIPAFRVVGIPIGVSNAYPEILPYISMQTIKAGGYGAVREVCDAIVEAKTAGNFL